MPIRNQFSTFDCLDAVGAYDNRGSLDLQDNVQFTMQLADFSRSFAAEAFEPRAFIYGGASVGAGVNQARCAIVPKTKPVVIESLRVVVTGTSTSFYFGVGPPLFVDEVIGGANLKADIGGKATTLAFFTGNTGVVVPGSQQFSLLLETDWTFPDGFRVYVKQGEAMMVAAVANSSSINVRAVCREVADIPRSRT